MTAFVPGLALNRDFYAEVVAPLVRPWRHGAALLGWGSDVAGYDTERSTDHGWGLRLQVFVEPDDVIDARRAIDDGLPLDFHGWPVRYGWDDVAVQHHVSVTTVSDWLGSWLGYDPRDTMSPLDWLVTPQQTLLGVVRGAVFHDDSTELTRVREQLTWYPDELGRWVVACQWKRIAQEESFTGRAAEVGDELGSRIAASRMVRELMCLWFLLNREYWPYTKWFGTAFARLDDSGQLAPHLAGALAASSDTAREQALVDAYETISRRHNAAGISEPVDPAVREYHGRGYRVLLAERFVDATHATISDPWLRELPLIGTIDQFVDSTDVLQVPRLTHRLRALYGGAS